MQMGIISVLKGVRYNENVFSDSADIELLQKWLCETGLNGMETDKDDLWEIGVKTHYLSFRKSGSGILNFYQTSFGYDDESTNVCIYYSFDDDNKNCIKINDTIRICIERDMNSNKKDKPYVVYFVKNKKYIMGSDLPMINGWEYGKFKLNFEKYYYFLALSCHQQFAFNISPL